MWESNTFYTWTKAMYYRILPITKILAPPLKLPSCAPVFVLAGFLWWRKRIYVLYMYNIYIYLTKRV